MENLAVYSSMLNDLNGDDANPRKKLKSNVTIDISSDSSDSLEKIAAKDEQLNPQFLLEPYESSCSEFEDVNLNMFEYARERKPQNSVSRHTKLQLAGFENTHKAMIPCEIVRGLMYNRACSKISLQDQLLKIPKYIKEEIKAVPTGRHTAISSRSLTFKNGLMLLVQFFRDNFQILLKPMASKYLNTAALSVSDIEKRLLEAYLQKKVNRLELCSLFVATARSLGLKSRLVWSLQVCTLNGSHLEYNKTEKIDLESIERELEANSANCITNEELCKFVYNLSIKDVYKSQYYHKVEEIYALHGYPIYWAEIYDDFAEKWIPVDVSVTMEINNLAIFEPKNNSQLFMIYVLSFDRDQSVYDVTVRYCKNFNAKTRKKRIDNTEQGKIWLDNIFKCLKSNLDSKESVQDLNWLRMKASMEKMPSNAMDFKDHFNYVLERHLKRNQIIVNNDQRPIGYVRIGKGSSEPVYPRSCIQIVKSARNWFKVGRVLKMGSQPVKTIERNNKDSLSLYLYNQTELYDPGEISSGKVPKKAFGAIEIYTETMIPRGAVHIKHILAQRVAETFEIDFAVAIVGQKFNKRRCVNQTQGIIVSKEYRSAIHLGIQILNEILIEERQKARDLEALALWKVFYVKLDIRDRVQNQYNPKYN